MGQSNRRHVVDALLERHGTTYAEEAGIRLGTDPKPSPLYRLLCLSTLLSARIRANVAVDAAHALSSARWRTARAMANSTWEERVRVLNRSGYARYDESTARMLGDTATMLLDRWNGDLRRLREEADHDPRAERRLLKEAKGIGDVGASVFLREIQEAWPEVGPALDGKAMDGARALGLGRDPVEVAGLVAGSRLAHLAAALVRVDLEGTADEVKAAANRR
jgi:endonuclease III